MAGAFMFNDLFDQERFQLEGVVPRGKCVINGVPDAMDPVSVNEGVLAPICGVAQ
jgi:hypothetical protein